MSRYKSGASAPPMNPEDRKAIEQRAREASAPSAPEKKGRWPFPVEGATDDEPQSTFGQKHHQD